MQWQFALSCKIIHIPNYRSNIKNKTLNMYIDRVQKNKNKNKEKLNYKRAHLFC